MPRGHASTKQEKHKEYRTKLLSVYLRPRTLVPEDGTVKVPFLTDTNTTAEQWGREYEIAAQSRKRRCTRTQQPVCDTALSTRAAWKDYLTQCIKAGGGRGYLEYLA